MLGADDDFELVAECVDGVEAREAIVNLRPDVIFLDIEMPRLSGMSGGVGFRALLLASHAQSGRTDDLDVEGGTAIQFASLQLLSGQHPAPSSEIPRE